MGESWGAMGWRQQNRSAAQSLDQQAEAVRQQLRQEHQRQHNRNRQRARLGVLAMLAVLIDAETDWLRRGAVVLMHSVLRHGALMHGGIQHHTMHDAGDRTTEHDHRDQHKQARRPERSGAPGVKSCAE